MWLASLEKERIDEVFDPEIAINRAINYYRKRGYDEKWIESRLRRIAKITRDNIEKEINRSVISKENALGYRYLEDNNKIENKSS